MLCGLGLGLEDTRPSFGIALAMLVGIRFVGLEGLALVTLVFLFIPDGLEGLGVVTRVFFVPGPGGIARPEEYIPPGL